jgi:hypothetical protein
MMTTFAEPIGAVTFAVARLSVGLVVELAAAAIPG